MRKIILALLLGITTSSFGQQIPQYSQYIRNQNMINPAATGAKNHMEITLGGRMQWAGFRNAPNTSYLYFASPTNKLKGAFMKRTFGKVQRNNKSVRHPRIYRGSVNHAIGAQLLVDQYGPFRSFKFKGSYAVHLPVNRDYNISFGVNLGLANRSFLQDRAEVLSVMTNTGMFDNTYNSYISNSRGQNTMELDAGIYFYGDNLFVGVSADQLTKDLVKFGNTQVNYDLQMHYMFTGGYRIQMNNRWTMTPAVLLKYMVPAPLSVEGTLQFEYNRSFWFGLSYRHKDAIVGVVGYNISDAFRISYSYDFSISRMFRHSSGGHELVLGIMLGKSGGSRSSI